jgi:hypothetical protein
VTGIELLSKPCFLKKSVKLACRVVNSNIAIVSLPTLQLSLGMFALFKQIYDGEQIFTVVSKGRIYNTVVPNKCMT